MFLKLRFLPSNFAARFCHKNYTGKIKPPEIINCSTAAVSNLLLCFVIIVGWQDRARKYIVIAAGPVKFCENNYEKAKENVWMNS